MRSAFEVLFEPLPKEEVTPEIAAGGAVLEAYINNRGELPTCESDLVLAADKANFDLNNLGLEPKVTVDLAERAIEVQKKIISKLALY